jgi:protein phosphatase
MNVEFFGNTDIGQVRQINEDTFALIPSANAMVVCDGMGGHAAGEVASAEAKKVFLSYFAKDPEIWAKRLEFAGQEKLIPIARHLVRAARLANRRIYNRASENLSARGMGTTLVVLAFDEGLVSICHVGDSRAYRLRDGKLERLTVDHSLAAELIARDELTEEESKNFAERNVITRALGTRPAVEVDIRTEATAKGDLYLGCSDGLCGFIEDALIEQILQEAGQDLKRAGDNLIKAANAAGGEDNITVALARVDDAGAADMYQPQEVMTIHDDDGAPGEVADAILKELAQVEALPDEDTQKMPTSGKSAKTKKDVQPNDPRPRSKSRWFLWLFLLVVVIVAVLLYGTDVLDPSDGGRAPSYGVTPVNARLLEDSLRDSVGTDQTGLTRIYRPREIAGHRSS